jgi:dienelactone hydrolase
MNRTDVTFTSDGTRCAAWLYRPEAAAGPVPCVVLAHGFTATRGARLDAYAERFAQAGLAALVFDYRHFGDSDGEPRQLLDIRRQLADWRAAVDCARGLEGVDPDRIAVWGSSFSGGHVMETAAADGRIAAVVAQAPFADGIAVLAAANPKAAAKITALALRDEARARLGRPPLLAPAVGPPGSAAAMTSPDAEPGFRAIAPPGWRNAFTPRVMLRIGFYRPGRKAARIGCPVLVCVCDDDAITPARPALRAAEAAPRGEVRRYPIGHFDIYLGEWFERTVADQTAFLARHLLGAGAETSSAAAGSAA